METDEDVPSEAVEQAAQDGADRISKLRGAAVRLDSQPALLAASRRLRTRLPGDEKFGDPLSTAGPTAVELVARGVSSLRPERESVVQELGLAGLQLWQSSLRGRRGQAAATSTWRSCSPISWDSQPGR